MICTHDSFLFKRFCTRSFTIHFLCDSFLHMIHLWFIYLKCDSYTRFNSLSMICTHDSFTIHLFSCDSFVHDSFASRLFLCDSYTIRLQITSSHVWFVQMIHLHSHDVTCLVHIPEDNILKYIFNVVMYYTQSHMKCVWCFVKLLQKYNPSSCVRPRPLTWIWH